METVKIEKCFVNGPYDDGNKQVVLKTDKGDVKYTVYPGKDNPFENYQEVNGRSIRCDLTQSGYIAKGQFEWVGSAEPVQTTQSNRPPSQAPTQSPASDPKQYSIQRQTCIKAAVEMFDTCVSNGVLDRNMHQDQMTSWVQTCAEQLHAKCLG